MIRLGKKWNRMLTKKKKKKKKKKWNQKRKKKGKEKKEEKGIQDDRFCEWVKFNDISISDEDSDTVMQQSIGGEGTTTAYYLIYMQADMFEQMQAQLHANSDPFQDVNYLTDDQIKKEIELDNKKFLETIEKYNKTQNEDKAAQFLTTYQNKLSEAVEWADQFLQPKNVNTAEQKRNHFARDNRIKNIYTFLQSMGFTDLMRSELIRDLYANIINTGIERDIDSSYYNKIKEKLGEEEIRQAVDLSLDDSPIEPYRRMYDRFHEINQFLSYGIGCILENEIVKGMAAFKRALELDVDLNPVIVKMMPKLNAVIKICLEGFFSQALLNLKRGINLSQSMQLIVSVSQCTVCILDKNDPVYRQFKDKVLELFNEKLVPVIEPDHRKAVTIFLGTEEDRKSFKLPNVQSFIQQYKRGEIEKWADLTNRLDDQIKKLSEKFPDSFSKYVNVYGEKSDRQMK